MARRKQLQTNFSAGELAPDIQMRQDTDQYQNGAKSLRNRRCMIGGGTKRRPGTRRMAELQQDGRAEAFVVNQTTRYVLVFSDGRMDAFVQDIATGRLTAAGSVNGAPWVGNIWREMDYEQAANTAFLVHKSMPPQRIVRTGAATWSLSAVPFFIGAGGRVEQPYFKIADQAISLLPSGRTGSITVTASAPVFTAAHVGSRIRILKREILVTGFTSTTVITGTVIEKLRATANIPINSTGMFALDEMVQGATTGVKGIVTSIPSSTSLHVVLFNEVESTGGGFSGSEKIVGPNGYSLQSADDTEIANEATKEWDEQLFSAQWGYPSCVALHRNRLLFGGHPVVPNALIGSKVDNLYSFDLGTQLDAEGIFETIGDAGASSIVQLHSAEQLIVFTDHGPYYVPEGQSAPFRPSSIAFYPFGSPWPITASAEPRGFDDGVLFVSGSLAIKARPTGNNNQLWSAGDDISLVASHLLNAPDRLAVVSNFDGRTERYAVMRNADGSLAVLQLVEVQKIRNMTPWVTDGAYSSIAGIGADLYATVQRLIGGVTRYFLEHFEQSLTLDCATEYPDLPALNAGVPADYGLAAQIHITTGSGDTALYLGTWPLAQSLPPPGPYTAGLYYGSEIETLPPVLDDQDGARAGEAMRINKSFVFVRGSQRFALSGYTISGYQVTDDVGAPPPVRNGPIEFEPTGGWVREPTVVIDQPDPLPLEVLAIKNIVNY